MNLQSEIYAYLQTQKLMALSTVGDEPWPAIVYYISDEELNLYFISHPDDIHSRNIAENNVVTGTIYDSSQNNAETKIGIQLRGQAEVVNTFDKVKWMVKLWNNIIAKENGFRPDPKDLLSAGKSRVYRVTPEKIKFYNEALFPEQKQQVLEL